VHRSEQFDIAQINFFPVDFIGYLFKFTNLVASMRCDSHHAIEMQKREIFIWTAFVLYFKKCIGIK
jgi:hypothetical protein